MAPCPLLLTFFFYPERYAGIGLLLLLAAELAILTTSLLGCYVGMKGAGELTKAGKLSLEY